jgi:hypothetical protein
MLRAARDRLTRRLRVIESNYGREYGRYVEHNGRQIAALTDPEWVDQFWFRYRVVPLTADPADLEFLRSDACWNASGGAVFRNREFGDVAPSAFGQMNAVEVLRETGAVAMRYLNLEATEYPCWDWFLLWLRRRRRAPVGHSGQQP